MSPPHRAGHRAARTGHPRPVWHMVDLGDRGCPGGRSANGTGATLAVCDGELLLLDSPTGQRPHHLSWRLGLVGTPTHSCPSIYRGKCDVADVDDGARIGEAAVTEIRVRWQLDSCCCCHFLVSKANRQACSATLVANITSILIDQDIGSFLRCDHHRRRGTMRRVLNDEGKSDSGAIKEADTRGL